MQVFSNSIPDSHVESVKDYIDLMFTEDIDSRGFEELNPLINTEFHVNGNGDSPKYLNFAFKRVHDEQGIDELMITVSDNTHQVILSRELDEKNELNQKHTEMLKILEVEPQLLKEFLIQTERDLMSLVSSLDNLEQVEQRDYIYRVIHSIKGNGSLLGLNFVAEKAHQFEEKLEYVHPKSNQFKEDYHYLKNILHALLKEVEDIKEFINNLRQFSEHFDNANENAGELIVKAVQNLIEKLTVKLDKTVNFDHSKFDGTSIRSGDVFLLKDIIIQLTRNAMVHGLECAADRKKAKKKPQGSISLSSKVEDNDLLISYNDDGSGLNIEKIRSKAIETGKWKKDDLKNWSDDQIAKLILVQGISTSDRADMFAGRGMGMSIIREKLNEINGDIQIKNVTGKSCTFELKIPVSR
jgi:chemotaxis protein histidine kinase CheA